MSRDDGIRALAARFDPEVFDAPKGRARVRLAIRDGQAWDAVIDGETLRLEDPDSHEPDALLTADERTWRQIAKELPAGMEAFRSRRLSVRRNLHLGVGLLAATSGATGPGRLRFAKARTARGTVSYLEAGAGSPVLLLHGLGATKASFLPTVAALAPHHRVLAIDLPGFGDSDKPLGAPYDAPFFAAWAVAFLDELDIGRADVVGNSMGGRVALEVGFRYPERTRRLGLLSPSLAWRRGRRWAPYLRWVRPELGLIQPVSRAVVERVVERLIPGARDGWVAAGVDEFLRAYLQPRGRAAFYAAARNVYLEDPDDFWTRLGALAPDSLFVWGRRDTLVPLAFARHVERALPSAQHVELDCGHVPQLERPVETHDELLSFFGAAEQKRAA